MGSAKQIWNTLSPLYATSTAEAEGVSMKMRSSQASGPTASAGLVVTVPQKICIFQSFRLL